MKLFSVPTFVILVLLSLQSVFGAGEISLKKENGSIAVTVDDKLFTRYVYNSDQRSKPILYPILGPLGLSMTRAYPIDALAKGEAKDHPHHASMWYTHGEVNGIDFWATGKGKGKVVHQDFLSIKDSSFTALNLWQNADGKTICQDERTLSFHAPSEEDRAIDISITIKATVGNVTFGDTKEGSMGIRMAPQFRLKGEVAKGSALNSEGIVGKAVWGKRASWVSYWAPFEEKEIGISIFDHPSNPRHPTWWHARDYGLVAANPFGLRHFEGKPKGEGNMVLKKGEEVTFHYRFLFHIGNPKEAEISSRYLEWSKAG
jgi:hypothetical protein